MKTKVPSRAGQALEPFLRLKINPPKEPVFLNKIASWICGCSSRNRRRAHNPSEDAYEDACEDEDGNCGCDYTQSSYPTSPYTMSLNIYHQGSLCSDYNGIHIEPAESREREEGLVRCEKQLCAGIDSADAPTTISPPISPMDIGASGSADDEVAAIFRLQLELEWRLILDREQCMRAMERWDPTVYLRSVVPEKSIGVDWNSCGATEQQSTATVIVPPVHKTTSDAIPILSALTARNVNSEIAADVKQGVISRCSSVVNGSDEGILTQRLWMLKPNIQTTTMYPHVPSRPLPPIPPNYLRNRLLDKSSVVSFPALPEDEEEKGEEETWESARESKEV